MTDILQENAYPALDLGMCKPGKLPRDIRIFHEKIVTKGKIVVNKSRINKITTFKITLNRVKMY